MQLCLRLSPAIRLTSLQFKFSTNKNNLNRSTLHGTQSKAKKKKKLNHYYVSINIIKIVYLRIKIVRCLWQHETHSHSSKKKTNFPHFMMHDLIVVCPILLTFFILSPFQEERIHIQPSYMDRSKRPIKQKKKWSNEMCKKNPFLYSFFTFT